jgi:hypothetical protein
MKIKLSNPERFCEFIKCPYYEYGNRLTSDFRCRNKQIRTTCEYLTSSGNPRIESRDLYFDYGEEDYRDPIIILSALMKCKHSNEDKAK